MEASRIEECTCTKNIWHAISYTLNMALTTDTPYLSETSRMTGNVQAGLCSYVYSLLWAVFTPYMQYVCNAYVICSRTMMLIEPTTCWCRVASCKHFVTSRYYSWYIVEISHGYMFIFSNFNVSVLAVMVDLWHNVRVDGILRY